ncbi:MAG: hypothetical protein HQK65_08465 [Desulfamplus sp.]|nr:hypothetical protein [Desulfamplus sp.]
MQKITQNIFVVTSPMQLFAVDIILNEMNDCGHVKNFVFIFYKSEQSFKIKNAIVFNYDTNTYIKKVYSIFRFKKDIDKILSSENTNILYIAHPFHFACNYLAFNNFAEKIYLLPDGILNYYEARIDNNSLKKMIQGKILCAMAGINYKMFKGHYTGYELGIYSGVYCFSEKRLLTKTGKIFNIAKTSVNIGLKPLKDICLFIDQPVNKSIHYDLAKRINDFFLSRQFKKIIYKKHPSYKCDSLKYLLNSGAEICLIESKMPIEMLFDEIDAGYIVSFDSSALLTLKFLYPDRECVSIGMDLFCQQDYQLYKIKKIFMEQGIVLL